MREESEDPGAACALKNGREGSRKRPAGSVKKQIKSNRSKTPLRRVRYSNGERFGGLTCNSDPSSICF